MDGPAPAVRLIPDEAASEQLRLQAVQLAAHLRGRQKELDHREAELNSRMARFESDARATRLWFGERENDLSQREQEVERRLAAEAVETQSERFRRAMADLEQKRQAVQRRAEHVDQCRAALEQLRAELGHMHRETLEVRLVTEELWARLSGAAPPAVLIRSIGRIRTQLAEQYRQANAELAERKKELEAIRNQLGAQHEKLAEHKLRFEQWAAGCQEDCHRQASRLVAREQKLHREEIRFHERFDRWSAGVSPTVTAAGQRPAIRKPASAFRPS